MFSICRLTPPLQADKLWNFCPNFSIYFSKISFIFSRFLKLFKIQIKFQVKGGAKSGFLDKEVCLKFLPDVFVKIIANSFVKCQSLLNFFVKIDQNIFISKFIQIFLSIFFRIFSSNFFQIIMSKIFPSMYFSLIFSKHFC